MGQRFALLLVVLLAFAAGVTVSAQPANIVVTMDREGNKPRVLLNSKPIQDPLRALSVLHEAAPERSVLLLIHPKTTIDELWNMLGVMSKAGIAKPRIFVFSEDKSVMNELDVGCAMLLSTDLNKVVPAHGGVGCSK